MVGSAGVQTFSHNTRLSASAMKKESGAAVARSNSGDSSSCLTGSSPRSSNESPSSGGRAKRERSPERPDTDSGKGGALLKGKRRFVGVRQRPSGRWVSEIKDTTQKIRLWLGTFDTAEDAARAYDEAAWLIRGANTRTNFVVAPSKAENSALPSKAARLLLLRKNAIATAAAAARPGSDDNISKQSQQQKKIQSLNESLYARASASAEPQRATPLSVHFLPPASDAPMPQGPKYFQQKQQQTEKDSTPRCSSSMLSSDSSHMGFDSNSSATDGEERGFRSSADLRSVKVERSRLVTLDNGMGVSKEECRDLEIKPRVHLLSSNNSDRGISMAEEMCGREISMRPSSAVNRDGSEKTYNDCHDGIRENSRINNSAVGFQVQQGETLQQDHNTSTPIAQQGSFDTDISSALSGLEDVDLGCVDSEFDFSAEMSMACSDNEPARINLDSLFDGTTPTLSTSSGNGSGAATSDPIAAYEDPDIFSDQMRQMMFGRQASAELYAMNGVHECLMLYNNSTPAPYCMSSPSLSLPSSFAKTPLPFKNSRCMSQGYVQHPSYMKQEFTCNMGENPMDFNIYSESGTFSSNQKSDYRLTSNDVGAEPPTRGSSELSQQVMMGADEALWNSWELTPLCPVT